MPGRWARPVKVNTQELAVGQATPDPVSRVSLFLRCRPVSLKPAVDDLVKLTKLWCRPLVVLFTRWRYCAVKRLAHGSSVNRMTVRKFMN